MSNTPTNTPTQNQYTNSELEQIAELQHRIFTCFGNISYKDSAVVAEALYKEGWRKQSENETLEAIDKFRSALMDEFLRLCCYNDYSKLTLLKIGDTIDRVYDKCIESMKGGAE